MNDKLFHIADKITVGELLRRWDTGELVPLAKRPINRAAFNATGSASSMSAQGHVLYFVGGWTLLDLVCSTQKRVDREVADLLGISMAHSVLLGLSETFVGQSPSVILQAPERVLGSQAERLMAFWWSLDAMDAAQWSAVFEAAWSASGLPTASKPWDATAAAESAAAMTAARAAARAATSLVKASAAFDATAVAGFEAAKSALANENPAAVWEAASAAGYAALEIIGEEESNGNFFLPMFSTH